MRDTTDVHKVLQWFESHDPFPVFPGLMSIANGIIAVEGKIQCHNAYNLGNVIMSDVTDQCYINVNLKKCKIAQPIAAAFNSFTTGTKKTKIINPLAIFQRISLLSAGKKSLQKYLSFELAVFPLSLFNEDGSKKTTKSEFYSIFSPSTVSEKLTDDYVIDGGYLLHRVVWPSGKKFNEITEIYKKYILRHFGSSIHVVFDGYSDITLKSMEHARWYQKSAPDVVVMEDNPFMAKQELFLANPKNKSNFTNLLCRKLKGVGINTSVAAGDADVLIVETAIQWTRTNKKRIIVVGEDVDLLVNLVALSSSEDNIFFLKPQKGQVQKQLYNISELTVTTKVMKPSIFFAHAFTGCDSTSAIYNRGKVRFWNSLMKSTELQAAAKIFNNPQDTADDIFLAGCKAFCIWFGISIEEGTLNQYRYTIYEEAVKKNAADLCLLCPTEGAARQHSYRVYAHVQEWLGNKLPITEWGWKKVAGVFIPVGTTDPPAPDDLLKKLFCGCKRGCKTGCGCRKLGEPYKRNN